MAKKYNDLLSLLILGLVVLGQRFCPSYQPESALQLFHWRQRDRSIQAASLMSVFGWIPVSSTVMVLLVTLGTRWTKAEVTWFLKTQDILSTTLCWTKQITEPAWTPGVARAHSCLSDSLHCTSNKGRLRCTKIKWWILGELSHH